MGISVGTKKTIHNAHQPVCPVKAGCLATAASPQTVLMMQISV